MNTDRFKYRVAIKQEDGSFKRHIEDALRARVKELEKITLILTDALEAFVETGDLRKSQCDGFISLAKETKKGGGE